MCLTLAPTGDPEQNISWFHEMNIAKMEAAKNAGFECFVVIDDLIIKYGDDLIKESLRSSPYPKKSS